MPANKARPRWGSKTNLKLYQYVYSKSQINQELDWNNIAALMGNERLPKTYKKHFIKLQNTIETEIASFNANLEHSAEVDDLSNEIDRSRISSSPPETQQPEAIKHCEFSPEPASEGDSTSEDSPRAPCQSPKIEPRDLYCTPTPQNLSPVRDRKRKQTDDPEDDSVLEGFKADLSNGDLVTDEELIRLGRMLLAATTAAEEDREQAADVREEEGEPSVDAGEGRRARKRRKEAKTATRTTVTDDKVGKRVA